MVYDSSQLLVERDYNNQILNTCLPTTNISTTPYNPGIGPVRDSYFNLLIDISPEIQLYRNSWCIDSLKNITPGQTYTSNIISSYDKNVIQTLNLNNIFNITINEIRVLNYMLNNIDVYYSPLYNATWVEFQSAIWTYLGYPIVNLSPNIGIVNNVVDNAKQYGPTWCPPYTNSIVGVIIFSFNSDTSMAQPQIAEFTVEELNNINCPDQLYWLHNLDPTCGDPPGPGPAPDPVPLPHQCPNPTPANPCYKYIGILGVTLSVGAILCIFKNNCFDKNKTKRNTKDCVILYKQYEPYMGYNHF